MRNVMGAWIGESINGPLVQSGEPVQVERKDW